MTTAHLSTIPDRENLLKMVLESIVPFVDYVFVSLNGYNHVPTWLNDFLTVSYTVTDNSLGDAFKFSSIDKVSGLVYVLDDDLLYSPQFFTLLQSKVTQYGCPCSLHGKKYGRPVRGFKYFKENYRCLNSVSGDHPVDIIGTGVLCFDTSMVKISMDEFKLPNMSDIWFSKICHSQGVPLMVVEHKSGIVQYLHPQSTIWSNTKDYSKHDAILKDFLK